MKAKVIAALVGALLISPASLVRAADTAKATPDLPVSTTGVEPRAFGGLVAGAVHLTATVESINYLTREVILKADTGERKAITVGPEVQRLTEIHQGDTIEIDYAESVTVIAGDGAGEPARDDNVSVQRMGSDRKPGGAVTATTTVRSTVAAIDYKARTVTLKGPNRTVTINVGPEAVNFDQLKVGDSVYLEFTRAVAAAVTKSAKSSEAPAPAK